MIATCKNTFASCKEIFSNFMGFYIQKRPSKVSAYNFLKQNYLFTVDSITGENISLQVLGTRGIHHVTITDIIGDSFLAAAIDPRELLQVGYFAYTCRASKLESLSNNCKQKSLLRKLILAKFGERVSEGQDKSYAYLIADINFHELKASLLIKHTSSYFELSIPELVKDVFLASEIRPSELLKLGYELGEKGIKI